MNLSSVYQFLIKRYPLELASDFDKVGLQIGNPDAILSKVLVALDVTEEVIDEAIGMRANLIIAHHPFIFTPIATVDHRTPLGRMLSKIFKYEINILILHTNYDVGSGGMNDILSSILQLEGAYNRQEEPKCDHFLRVGTIEPISLKLFAKRVERLLYENQIRFVGDPDRIVSRIGISGGGGSSELEKAIEEKCDVFITAEIKHHEALLAKGFGLALIETSHSIERIFIQQIVKELKSAFPNLDITSTSINPNPFQKLM